MKNKEKFAKEIVEITVNGHLIAVDKNNHPMACDGFYCDNCILYTGRVACRKKLKEWAEAEYVETKVFTEEEKAFIRVCDKIKYVVRDKNENLIGSSEKPTKCENWWKTSWGADTCIIKHVCSCEFSAVKWEDSEPTSREEILK